jgi:RimJ/RimL family protein N-acetyltransferase
MILGPTPFTLKDGTPLILRSPLEPDAEAVLTYARAMLRESHANMNHGPTGFDGLSVADEARILAEAADTPGAFFLSAFDAADRVVGNLNLMRSKLPKLAHSGQFGMGCLAAYHGQGLGRGLLARTFAEAQAAGVWRLQLQVRTFNAPAIALYESLGFTRVGTLQAHCLLEDGGFADEYVYERLGQPPSPG